MVRSSTTRSVVVSLGFTLLIGPGPAVVLVPWLLTRWEIGDPLLGIDALRVLGAVLVVAGLPVLLESIVRFVRKGRGTLTPAVPTEHLVVSGLYRYVRNPMYVAVVTMIVGQGLLFGSVPVLVWAAALWIVFTAFVMLYEEPTLRRTFGAEYEAYCSQVRRWVPRVTPATPPSSKTLAAR